MFTLKIILDETAQVIRPVVVDDDGAKTLRQVCAFRHLVKTDVCDASELDNLLALASLHNWSVNITKK